jgi:hypothetical protein
MKPGDWSPPGQRKARPDDRLRRNPPLDDNDEAGYGFASDPPGLAVLREVVETPQSQDRTPRHAIGLAAPAAASDIPRERFSPLTQMRSPARSAAPAAIGQKADVTQT